MLLYTRHKRKYGDFIREEAHTHTQKYKREQSSKNVAFKKFYNK
jgi:hypothetical protein